MPLSRRQHGRIVRVVTEVATPELDVVPIAEHPMWGQWQTYRPRPVDADSLRDYEAAFFVGQSTRVLQAFRTRRPGGPPFRRMSNRTIRYSLEELIDWEASQVTNYSGD